MKLPSSTEKWRITLLAREAKGIDLPNAIDMTTGSRESSRASSEPP
jgi:hypothetical protein